MEKRHRLELIGITYNQIESGVYALVLQQVGGKRRIPIIIGYPEAQAIECKLQDVATPRPLMHDTMLTTLEAYGINLLEVEIKKTESGVFTADLLFSNGREKKVIDSRSSDAIALAIRTGAPIYTSDSVLREAGFDHPLMNPGADMAKNTEEEQQENGENNDLKKMNLAQLSEAMNKAAESEDYEEAARIKSEIDLRNSQD